MNCSTCKAALPDLLLDPATAHADARVHVTECPSCAAELAELKATFELLDSWSAPEVSPYFDQKLAVRLREEQEAPAMGWFEQLRTRLLFNTGRQFRPALVGVMAALLIAGGGGLGLSTWSHRNLQAQFSSPTVNDLQILDNNQQALEQVDQLLQEDTPDNSDAPQI